MAKIRVAQIGVGHDHASGFMDTMRRMPETYEVVGVCAESAEYEGLLRTNPCYDGIPRRDRDDILGDGSIDAILVETEEHSLVPNTLLAIGAGFPVHMDKPGGEELSAFTEMVRRAEAKRLPFQMGYMYRYNPAVRMAEKMARDGELGDIIAVDAQMSVRHPPEKRAWLNRFRGGMMFFLGCHLVDMIYRFQGIPLSVTPMNRHTRTEGIDCPDYGFAVFDYGRAISFAKTSAAEVNGFDRRQLVITGTKASVELKPFEYYVKGGMTTGMKVTRHEPGKEWRDNGETVALPPIGRYDKMMEEFAAAVRGDMALPYTYQSEIDVQKMVLEACGIPV